MIHVIDEALKADRPIEAILDEAAAAALRAPVIRVGVPRAASDG